MRANGLSQKEVKTVRMMKVYQKATGVDLELLLSTQR